MGSMIILGIGKMEIDWGKNNIYNNHSCLFQEKDLKIIPYYYANNEIEYKKGFSKNINSVKRRLNLLGYNLNQIEDIFSEELEYVNQLYGISLPIKFNDYYNILKNINVKCNVIRHMLHN